MGNTAEHIRFIEKETVTLPADNNGNGRHKSLRVDSEDVNGGALERHLVYDLLISCALPRVSELNIGRIRSLCEKEVAWDDLIRAAILHGLLPLVHRNLMHAAPDLIPPDRLREMEVVGRQSKIQNVFLTKELARLTQLFDRKGVEFLALKGPVLAEQAYGSLSLRPFSDLDILVRKNDFRLVEKELCAIGYETTWKAKWFPGVEQLISLHLKRQHTFTRGNSFHLDLHTAIMPPRLSYTPDFDELMGRSVEMTVAGALVRVPDIPDTILLLCYHGAKNRWELLKYVCDLAGVIESCDVEWEEVKSRAHSIHGERVLLLGLALTQSMLGTKLPRDLLHAIEQDPQIKRLQDYITSRLAQNADRTIIDFRGRAWLNLAMQNSIPARLRYLFYAMVRRLWDKEQQLS